MTYTQLITSGNHVKKERLAGTEMFWETQVAVGTRLGFADHLTIAVTSPSIGY